MSKRDNNSSSPKASAAKKARKTNVPEWLSEDLLKATHIQNNTKGVRKNTKPKYKTKRAYCKFVIRICIFIVIQGKLQ